MAAGGLQNNASDTALAIPQVIINNLEKAKVDGVGVNQTSDLRNTFHSYLDSAGSCKGSSQRLRIVHSSCNVHWV